MNRDRMNRRRLLTFALLAPGALLAGRAAAQGSLLDQARGALGGLPKLPSTDGGGAGGLPVGEVAAGLKEALRVGSGRVVDRVGAKDGFNLDPAIRIPLPGPLETVRKALGRLGMGGLADDLATRMNHAAETASTKARPLFWDAIERMTLDDAMGVYNGPQDAATRYFERQMTPGLTREMTPVVDGSLKDAGAVRAYDDMMGQYRNIPLVPDAKANLVEHTVQGGLKGVFHYLGKEEAAIRQNPAARTTDLLKKVFG